MSDILVRTSSSAVTMVGTPEQIKALINTWIKQYGRDMPLKYILMLQSENHTHSHASIAG